MKPALLPPRHRASIRRAAAMATALLATALAGLPAVAEVAGQRVSGSGAGRVPQDHIGLQLYSLRDQLARDVPATLDKVKGLGIRNVELAGTYGLSAAAFKALLDARGLSAVSAHFDYARLRDDIDGVLRDARTLGLQYAGGGWIPHDDKLPFDEKTMRAAIVVFNKAGEALARQGIKFFLHTHGYEFQPWQRGTLFDLLMAETKPEFVALQMDVFWIVHAGQDPVKLLERYGSRWQLMHLKGMKESTPTGLFTGHSAVTNCVPIGTGKIDYAPILRTARAVGVKWYFIEDESPAAEQQIPQSLRYLVAAMGAPSTPASGATVPRAAPSGAGPAGVPSSATSSPAEIGAGGGAGRAFQGGTVDAAAGARRCTHADRKHARDGDGRVIGSARGVPDRQPHRGA